MHSGQIQMVFAQVMMAYLSLKAFSRIALSSHSIAIAAKIDLLQVAKSKTTAKFQKEKRTID
jgi:hypothetical protein